MSNHPEQQRIECDAAKIIINYYILRRRIMFKNLIFVLFLVFMLSLVNGVTAQDVVITSPGVVPEIDGRVDEVWFFLCGPRAEDRKKAIRRRRSQGYRGMRHVEVAKIVL